MHPSGGHTPGARAPLDTLGTGGTGSHPGLYRGGLVAAEASSEAVMTRAEKIARGDKLIRDILGQELVERVLARAAASRARQRGNAS